MIKMGVAFFDFWSVLHFMGGVATTSVLSRFKWVPWTTLLVAILIHQIWELYENSKAGTELWNTAVVDTLFNQTLCVNGECPLGYARYDGDHAINSASDTLFFALGSAFVLLFVTHKKENG